MGKGVGVRVTTVEVDKMTLIGDRHPETSGCICRACFRNFEKYGKLEATLAENMRKAIAILPTCSTATSTVTQERGSKDEHGSGDETKNGVGSCRCLC